MSFMECLARVFFFPPSIVLELELLYLSWTNVVQDFFRVAVDVNYLDNLV